MHCMVQGIYISYEMYGQGPPILCLHGWNENGKVFLTSSYRRFLRGYTVYAVDLPGFGKSPALISLDFPTVTTLLNEFGKEMGFDKFALLGQCMGGIIALDYTIRFTERVRKLFLVETMIYFPFWLNFMLYDRLGQWVLKVMQYRKLGITLLTLSKALRAGKRNRLSLLLRNLNIRQSLNYIKLMKDYSRINHLARVTGIEVPTDIIVSSNTFKQVRQTANDLYKTMKKAKIINAPAKSHFIFE